MGFGNKQTLISALGDENYLNDVNPDKLTEISEQISDFIYQQTGITPPADPKTAPGILRNIWKNIVLFEIIQYQPGISDEEKTRRLKLYDGAIDLLLKISTGEVKIMNASGVVISNFSKVASVQGTNRLDVTP